MIARDKIGHAMLGALVGSLTAAAVRLIGYDWILAGIAGTVAAGIVGVGKEIYDYANPKRHTVEAADALATFGPGSLAAWLVAILALLVLGGCSTRETARALTQADQAIEAVGLRMTGDEAKAILADPELPQPIRDRIRALVEPSLILLTAARESLRPALSLVSAGAPVEVETTAPGGAADPAGFARAAARQVGRAEQEVAGLLHWARLPGLIAGFVAQVQGDWVSSLLLLLGGGGGAAAIAVKIGTSFVKSRRVQDAMASYAKEAGTADPANLEAVKDRHLKAQVRAGIHGDVVRALRRAHPDMGSGGTAHAGAQGHLPP